MRHDMKNILIRQIGQNEWPIYRTLTFPYHRKQIEESQIDILAIGAMHSKEPIGLGIVHLNTYNQTGELLSLYVSPPFRNQQIGSNLLAEIEKVLSYNGYDDIFATYATQLDSSIIIEHILSKRKWQRPSIKDYLYKVDIAQLLDNSVYLWRFKLTDEYSVLLWNDLSDMQTRELESWENANRPQPGVALDELDSNLSFALCHKHEIVGWVTNKPLTVDTARLLSLYIQPNHRNLGFICVLLRNMFTGLRTNGFQFSSVYTTVSNRQIQNTMNAFVRPYLVYECEMRMSSKKLLAEQDQATL